jgi:predicted amidophosphoribosyltransferase
LTYWPELLIKFHNINPQAGLQRKQRLENVRNAFKLNKKFVNLIKNKNILLIDDVVTTGATINECTKVLKSSGASKIFCLTLAKTVND